MLTIFKNKRVLIIVQGLLILLISFITIVSSLFFFNSFFDVKTPERSTVTVTGVSEKEVKADHALLSLYITDLPLSDDFKKDSSMIAFYLKEIEKAMLSLGFLKNELDSMPRLDVSYRDNKRQVSMYGYEVKTRNIELIMKLFQDRNFIINIDSSLNMQFKKKLIHAILSASVYYSCTRVNDFKSGMLAISLKDAWIKAQECAKNMNVNLGKIESVVLSDVIVIDNRLLTVPSQDEHIEVSLPMKLLSLSTVVKYTVIHSK